MSVRREGQGFIGKRVNGPLGAVQFSLAASVRMVVLSLQEHQA
jgi:hypothetical protein